MIISWNWLRRYCDLSGLDPVESAHRFTITTAEIEEVISPPSQEFLNQFVVAQVVSVGKHPNADKLRCCKVNDGEKELSIVCGAANVREGLKTILAPIGCQFDDFKIKKSKLRGELSEGMLCSEKELGVGPGDEGIVELNDDLEVGLRVGSVYSDLGVQWDLDNKAITHRPDLWGHYGLAREAASVFARDLAPLELEEVSKDGGSDGFSVNIETPDLCRRYCGLSLSGIEVGPSPLWLQGLLREVGQEPINNVVDATNFVMLELGQPTHAFDVSRLPGKNISVGRAKPGEPFDTLTGKSVELCEDDLVIRCDGQSVALAGVVGGENSSIQDSTTDVFLEAAHFAPLVVRKTAKSYDLRTDSSARFEKSLDPCHAEMAIRRLVFLLKETCPKLVVNGAMVDEYPNPIPSRTIELAPTQVEKKMGFSISVEEQKNILTKLGFEVVESELLQVTVPSYRNTKDIEEPIDLVEEIGRIAGYDRIVPQSPRLSLESKPASLSMLRARRLQDFFVGRGYDEVKTYSFTSLSEMEALSLATEKAMALANPMSREQTHMRTGLLVRHAQVWKENAKHLDEFKMFEMGVVFEHHHGEHLPRERQELLLSSYGPSESGEGFFELKDDTLGMLCSLGIEAKVVAAQGEKDLAHTSRVGSILSNGEDIGYVAELHPSISSGLGLKKRVNFAVIHAPLALPEPELEKYKGLDRFPSVAFTLSLLVPKRTTIGEVMDLLQDSGGEIVQDMAWLGNYEGESIPEGQLSMTVTMNFRRSDRTMKGDEIQALQDQLVAAAHQKGYHLREG